MSSDEDEKMQEDEVVGVGIENRDPLEDQWSTIYFAIMCLEQLIKIDIKYISTKFVAKMESAK